MILQRSSGILLHPTSLPSKYGIGDMGNEAYEFIDFLIRSRQSLWQILPLTPPGYGESPYQGFSAFAGNSYLISIDKLMEDGLILPEDLEDLPKFNDKRVEFQRAMDYKLKVFRRAFSRFNNADNSGEYESFLSNNSYWLFDYCFFMALKNHHNERPWNQWDDKIAYRTPEGIEHYKKLLREEIEFHHFLQYIFDKQWKELKAYANENHIKIIGDLPIFISYDSSDAWTQPHLFEVDEKGNPTKVAGVPPDYFSKTGQLWGNPHFRWDKMMEDDFLWWRYRFAKLMELVDIIRIDHFRGFEAYWEIPASAPTAATGKWVKAPGAELFTTIFKHLKELPVVVEDLGFITPEVNHLKNRFQFPGMKIIQFSFGPHNPRNQRPMGFEANSVVYTGTHDNETSLGWYKSLVETGATDVLNILDRYYGIHKGMDGKEICWRLIEITMTTASQIAIIPMQDVLCLDNEGRMNYPGTVGGNWDWRFTQNQVTPEMEQFLVEVTEKTGRGR
ncbi:4-alpha-glucanotransferase [Alkaliphilus serpentinus]|uniref:4-alpha-glucanotransferase n=1 Tax=Alkaliphilus serpentinus TaxID=1482731 RepID=A0A833HMR6_9FIRM|nr:4-alpha-glucanotransferase [Alkaliphilus serpentinus]KAB3528809.1 4-alpha-glucanotransferase [Alkaliphilus serpentinus]